MRSIFEGLLVALSAAVMFLFSSGWRKRRNQTTQEQRYFRDTDNEDENSFDFFKFLRAFVRKGGLKYVFPGDDSRDTSVQMELISQVNCTTSVGRPISVTSRNVPTDRRRMRVFGGIE